MAERDDLDLESTADPVIVPTDGDDGPAPAPRPEERSLEARLRDHGTIGRLADNVLPALIAQLSASVLGEIEVREGDWKVRLRRPADALGPMYGRRATDRPSRSQPGHAGHGHAPGAVEPHRGGRGRGDGDVPGAPAGDDSAGALAADPAAGGVSSGTPAGGPATESPSGAGGSNGLHRHLTAVGPGPDPGARVGRMGHLPEGDELPSAGDDRTGSFSFRAIATSPAVGIFQSRSDVRAGSRVRAGDRLATVDVLGVAQPVLAPADGLVGATLVEHGEPVEYGQELIRIELSEPGDDLLEASAAREGSGSAPAPASAPAPGSAPAPASVPASGSAAPDGGPSTRPPGGEG